jgi:type II secretory pathway component PulK
MRIRPASSPVTPRRGVVLMGVLVVVVIRALMAYHYSDRMVTAHQSEVNAHRAAQLRHIADSGVFYAAAMLASPDSIESYLNGNPFDNPDRFRDVPVPDLEGFGQGGFFTLAAPIDPDQNSSGSGCRIGVTCEAGKININAMMKRDATGQQLYNMLIKLPNVSIDLAAAIVDYVDADTDIREGGAEDEFYSGQAPPRRCKNGPLDSIEELLLIKDMSPGLLYGSDMNRNGIIDPDEEGNGYDPGLASFLTVTSREPNRDATGQPLVNVNGDDLTVLTEKLSPLVSEDVLKFIILMRQYGPASSTGGQQSLVGAIVSLLGGNTGRLTVTTQKNNTQQATPVMGNLADFQPDLTKAGSKKLTSLLDLVGAQVSVPGTMGQPATIYVSPFADAKTAVEMLPALYQATSLNDDPEIPARINVNTAPREVLMCIDGLTEADVETIIGARPKWGTVETPSAEFQSLAWLASQANLSLTTLKTLEKVMTTRSQVFHMRVIGRFESGTGPTSRVEAIVDANFGRPRIVYYRDWSELGRTNLPQ